MQTSPNCMRPLNRTSRSSLSWNSSTVVACMAISRWSPIARCLSSRPNSSGARSYKLFITVIREMWPIETSSWRTYCWMRPRRGSRWSISASQLAFHTRGKWKYSAVHHPIWLPRSSARLSILDLRLTYGLSESSSMPCFVANSHSEVRTTKSFTIISEHRTYSSLRMSLPQLVSSFRNFSTRHLNADWVPSRSCRIRGARFLHRSTRCLAQISTDLPNKLSRTKVSIRLRDSSQDQVAELA